MKKIFLVINFIVLLFVSCETEFDVNAERQEIMVVYGLLDSSKDTQYLKINKAFLGENDAMIMAQNSDLTNFPTSDLRVLIYKMNNNEIVDSISLDDTLLFKENGVFPVDENIIYYFMNNNFLTGGSSYYLSVKNLKNENSVTSSTNLINTFSFNNFNSTQFLFGFYNNNPQIPESERFLSKTMQWNKVPNGEIYQLDLRFNYSEKDKVTQNLINKSVLWSQPLEEFSGGLMTSEVEGVKFFNFLQQNIEENADVERRFLSIDIIMTVGTTELNTYIKVNEPITGIVQHRPPYTNILDGIGLFSSRYTYSVNTSLTTDSRNYIINQLNRSFE